MTTPAHQYRQPAPTAQDASLARISGERLSRCLRKKKPLAVKIMASGKEHAIELPAGAVALLMEILEAMAAGRGVTLIPENAELTTVQAANLLNVSRPFLIKLLDDRAIPHRLVGRHRRVLMDDVMAYKSAIDRQREAVLDQLTAEAKDNDLGYSRP